MHEHDKNQEIMSECHDICLMTVSHCLRKGGRHAQADHITLLLDCSEICQTAADFMLRQSTLHPRICQVCADVCDRCAEDCESFADGDEMMRDCAQICRRCAQVCRDMAGTLGQPQHAAT
jgi:hypothetical protein